MHAQRRLRFNAVDVDPMGHTIPASSTSDQLSPGDVVAERYKIEETLGQGVMGTVYRVEHVHMHKRYALKVLDRAWVGSAEMVARFEREAIAAGHITDPHVAQATDFGRLADGSCFLVLEFVDGRTLRSALERGAFKPLRALAIARSIATALQAAHSLGIIHRDLKPENIMLVDRDGDRDFVKVLDFGLARFESTVGSRDSPGALTRQGAIVGTLSYMSPEQVMGQRVDARTDLYALGVILFEMLTGHCPFQGEPIAVAQQHVGSEAPPLPPSIRTSAGERAADVLRRLLAKTPEGRFATAGDAGAALDGCLAALLGPRNALPAVAPVVAAPPPRVKTEVLPAPRVAPRSSAPRASKMHLWSSLVTWSSGIGGRLRSRRRRRSLRDALVWPKRLLAKLPAWPSRRRLKVMTTLRAYASRLASHVANLSPSSAALRRWWWVFAVGATAVALAVITVLVQVVVRSTHVAPAAGSASARAATKPTYSSSTASRSIPKASAAPSPGRRAAAPPP